MCNADLYGIRQFDLRWGPPNTIRLACEFDAFTFHFIATFFNANKTTINKIHLSDKLAKYQTVDARQMECRQNGSVSPTSYPSAESQFRRCESSDCISWCSSLTNRRVDCPKRHCLTRLGFTSRDCSLLFIVCAFSRCFGRLAVTTAMTTTDDSHDDSDAPIHLATYNHYYHLLARAHVYVHTQMANGFESQINLFLCNLEKTSLRSQAKKKTAKKEKAANFCITWKAQRQHCEWTDQQRKEKQLCEFTIAVRTATFKCVFFLVIQHIYVYVCGRLDNGAVDMCAIRRAFLLRKVYSTTTVIAVLQLRYTNKFEWPHSTQSRIINPKHVCVYLQVFVCSGSTRDYWKYQLFYCYYVKIMHTAHAVSPFSVRDDDRHRFRTFPNKI